MTENQTSSALGATADLGIDWTVGAATGWHVFGLNLALVLARRRSPSAVFLRAPVEQGLPRLVRARLHDMLAASAEYIDARAGEWPKDRLPRVALHPLGNHLAGLGDERRARRNVGIAFVEDSDVGIEAIARSMAYDTIVAGSSWNAELLRGAGIGHVKRVVQGIDPWLFHPAPPATLFPERFVIFSGGKLEFRKGQDLVVAAFREFRRRHPDALLVTAWHNQWPDSVADLDLAGHVVGRPAVHEGRLAVRDWLVANGVPPDAVLDLGPLGHWSVPLVLRQADVGLFPNRCEGGTNLVAMECMACGVPAIVSLNTGHRDLVDGPTCFPLERQRPVAASARHYRGTDGWGESDVEEIVETLERVYTDRAEAAQRAAFGARLMASWAWDHQVDRLLDAIGLV